VKESPRRGKPSIVFPQQIETAACLINSNICLASSPYSAATISSAFIHTMDRGIFNKGIVIPLAKYLELTVKL
jgi:hypothetical protein